MANVSHKHVYCTSLHYPMSIRAIDPVCPLAILLMRVTLFPSETIGVTNIASINCNDTLFYSELNGEHADESFFVAISYSVSDILMQILIIADFAQN